MRMRPAPEPNAIRRQNRLDPWSAAADLIFEITATAERIAKARNWAGERAQRSDSTWRLLEALERSRYCLAIADVARALGMRRQSAHELVHATAAAGYVELLSNPDDRRILQVFLTPQGQAELSRVRTTEGVWLQLLLSGLADRRMATVTHVLRVIRQRLERDERERRRVEREERDRRRLSRDRFFG